MVDRTGDVRGSVICSVTGQTLDSSSGLALIHIAPLVSEEPSVAAWMKTNLTTPNCLHLVKNSGIVPKFGLLDYHVQLVHKWRLRHRAGVKEKWAKRLFEPGGYLHNPGRPAAPAEGPEGVQPPAAPVADGAMQGVARTAAALGLPLDEGGGGVADGPPLVPPGGPLPDQGGLPGVVPPGLPPANAALPAGGLETPKADIDFPRIVHTLIKAGYDAHSRKLPPALSVREKLAARAGALYFNRTLRRAIKEAEAEQYLTAAPSDEEGWFKELQDSHRSRKRHRRRKKKKKGKKSSSSSATSSSSTHSDQPFRKASSAGSSGGRAARDADRVPHYVLVDTLSEIASVLPRPVGEAIPSKAVLYKQVPALFMSFFAQVLKPTFEATGGSARDEREAMTICQTIDSLLIGETMRALMVQIGRLKALKESKSSSGGWTVAQHFEVIPTRSSGLTSGRDRHNAMRDHREASRLQLSLSGRGLPPRGGGTDRAG